MDHLADHDSSALFALQAGLYQSIIRRRDAILPDKNSDGDVAVQARGSRAIKAILRDPVGNVFRQMAAYIIQPLPLGNRGIGQKNNATAKFVLRLGLDKPHDRIHQAEGWTCLFMEEEQDDRLAIGIGHELKILIRFLSPNALSRQRGQFSPNLRTRINRLLGDNSLLTYRTLSEDCQPTDHQQDFSLCMSHRFPSLPTNCKTKGN